MSRSETFLAVIALATLVMALVQVGAMIVTIRLGQQARQALDVVQREIRPLAERVNAIADDVSKTTALASARAQKVDRLVTDLSRRVEETAAIVQEAIVMPAREGMAIVAAVKAGLGALRGLRDLHPRQGRTADEEDPLFIG